MDLIKIDKPNDKKRYIKDYNDSELPWDFGRDARLEKEKKPKWQRTLEYLQRKGQMYPEDFSKIGLDVGQADYYITYVRNKGYSVKLRYDRHGKKLWRLID